MLYYIKIEKRRGTYRMDATKLDRRVRYTKLMLRQSLLELMKKEDVDKISVTDICKQADINRSTFYAHYSTPTDLLNQIEEELFDKLNVTLGRFSEGGQPASHAVISDLVQYLADNSDLCKILLGKHGDSAFLKKVLQLAQQRSFRAWASEMDKSKEANFAYLYSFIANGSVGLIQDWIEGGMREKPEAIANIIATIAAAGFSAFAGRA